MIVAAFPSARALGESLDTYRRGKFEMDRKYQRVGVGVGAFHNPPRARYSEETRNLVKRK